MITPAVSDLFAIAREQGLGVTAWARAAGVSRSALSRALGTTRTSTLPSAEYLSRLAEPLGLDLIFAPKKNCK